MTAENAARVLIADDEESIRFVLRETLEEIGIRAVAQWRSLGGEALRLVPSLNAHPVWVDGLARMLRQHA